MVECLAKIVMVAVGMCVARMRGDRGSHTTQGGSGAVFPMKKEQRTIDEPRVKFLPREDGHDYCARITGIPVTPTSKPMACAFWNVRRKECTIVTPLQTGYNYLGHELRHCFEGSFHD